MIQINNLQKKFGEKIAVNIESYTIPQGDMLGLVGNNGAGKTTLFRLILDLLKANGGNVTINGIEVSKSEEWKNTTGAFIDDGFLIDYLTPEEYFYFIGKMYGLKKEEVDERLAPFERFMNGEVMGQKKFIRNFSMGNKQKIGIISAMLHHPQLLILDEPTAGLDVMARESILNLFREYMEEDGERTILISSHISSDLEGLCDDIYMIHEGRIIFHEDTDVLLNQYGLLKVDEKQFEELDKRYLLKKRKEHYGYACLTKEKQYYIENYPDIVVEKGTVDELIAMMIGGNEL